MKNVEVEVVCNRQTLIYSVSVQMVDALAWLCTQHSDWEPANINLDRNPDPGTLKALRVRELVQVDEHDQPQPTAAGLAVVQKMDELFSPGRKYSGLRDTALVMRVQASGKSQARRGPRVERSTSCASCGVTRSEDNEKYWRRSQCNPCYQRDRYNRSRTKAREDARTQSDPAISVPKTYERTEGQRTKMLSVRLPEDDYYLFLALSSITEQTNAATVRGMVHQSALAVIAEQQDLSLDKLRQTGKQLFQLAGKRF